LQLQRAKRYAARPHFAVYVSVGLVRRQRPF
jgi:hypothetical protein